MRVLAVRPKLGQARFWDDRGNHGGDYPIAQIAKFLPDNPATPNVEGDSAILLTCPTCGSQAILPVTGANDRPRVQRLAVAMIYLRMTTADGTVLVRWAKAKRRLRLKIAALEPDSEWTLDRSDDADDRDDDGSDWERKRHPVKLRDRPRLIQKSLTIGVRRRQDDSIEDGGTVVQVALPDEFAAPEPDPMLPAEQPIFMAEPEPEPELPPPPPPPPVDPLPEQPQPRPNG